MFKMSNIKTWLQYMGDDSAVIVYLIFFYFKNISNALLT